MDPLSFIAKIIGVTARVGAVFALAALIFYLGRRADVEFVTKLDPVIFQTIIVAGIIGACSVVVEIGRSTLLLGLKVFGAWLPGYRERQRSKRTALMNMGALTCEYADTLRFLKSNSLKRFVAPCDSTLLYRMEKAYLLQIDDPNWSAYSISTYYVVPDYVWSVIDERLKHHPVPAFAPWAADSDEADRV